MIEVPLERQRTKIGDRVSYEDVANPKRVGTVIGERDVEIAGQVIGSNFLVRWDNGVETWSDLRQHGWQAVRLREFHVLIPAHVTFTKWVIEEETLERAQAVFAQVGTDGAEYVGYIDADWTDGPEPDWSEPFNSYVEGHG